MTKKILSIVLAVVMLMGVLAVGASAKITDYELAVNRVILGGIEKMSQAEATWQTKINGYLTKDPDIITRNLAYWSDEIIADYNAASTSTDWKNLYNKMIEGEEIYDGTDLTGFYPSARRGKETIAYKYEVIAVTDANGVERENLSYAQAGDKITLRTYIKSNFLAFNIDVGVIYEFGKVTFDEDEGITQLFGGAWAQVGNDLSDYGMVGTKDYRAYRWPVSLRNQDAYNTYKMAKAEYATDVTMTSYPLAEKFDEYTPIADFHFIVNNGIEDGTTINFFNVEDSSAMISELETYDTHGETVLVRADRALSSVCAHEKPDGYAHFDHIWTFENATLTAGEEPVAVPADYTALEAAINAFDAAANEADYTAATWAAYADAAAEGKAVPADLLADDQDIIDDAAAAITAAAGALAKNEVKSAAVVGNPVIGANATVNVKVDGAPSKIVLNDGTDTLSFTAQNAIVNDNGDGTQTWTIEVFADSESKDYDVYAKYANLTETPVSFTLTASPASEFDLSIHSIIIPDMYPDALNGGSIIKGKHTIIIKTSTDVCKIQFVDPKGTIESGSTYTYDVKNSAGNCSYTDENGERTWTITHSFNLGTWSLPIRTRAESTTFATTGDAITARVVY